MPIDSEVTEMPSGNNNQEGNTPYANQEEEENVAGGLKKRIRSLHDLDHFQVSHTYNEFLGFILSLNDAVLGKPLSFPCQTSPVIEGLVNMMDTMKAWTTDIPPKPHRTRFGNESFCLWYDQLKERAPALVQSFFPSSAMPETSELSYDEVLGELVGYLTSSVGDYKRIDYGSGHEAHFIAFLYCLYRVGLVANDDCALVLRVFYSYIKLMRHLQEVYWLEPAGSQGVWGLDDYQFLPFLWGAAQLRGHKYIKPRSTRSKEIIEGYANEFMYLGCIHFITKVKTGSMVEHSPMLVDISGVKTWDKVNEGMVKMYKAQLLHKYPVMQHFLFGKMLPYEGAPEGGDHNCTDDHSHSHAHSHPHSHQYPTCCISRLPSSFANDGDKRPRSVFSALD